MTQSGWDGPRFASREAGPALGVRAGRGVAYAANVDLDAARLPIATFAAI
jgi:hypothetical protein